MNWTNDGVWWIDNGRILYWQCFAIWLVFMLKMSVVRLFVYLYNECTENGKDLRRRNTHRLVPRGTLATSRHGAFWRPRSSLAAGGRSLDNAHASPTQTGRRSSSRRLSLGQNRRQRRIPGSVNTGAHPGRVATGFIETRPGNDRHRITVLVKHVTARPAHARCHNPASNRRSRLQQRHLVLAPVNVVTRVHRASHLHRVQLLRNLVTIVRHGEHLPDTCSRPLAGTSDALRQFVGPIATEDPQRPD